MMCVLGLSEIFVGHHSDKGAPVVVEKVPIKEKTMTKVKEKFKSLYIRKALPYLVEAEETILTPEEYKQL